MYRYAAGIDAVSSDAGFHTIALHPNFDARLGHLDFTYQSPYGPVKSTWKVVGVDVAWEITIPPNTTARLPIANTNATAFTIDGAALAQSARVHATDNGIYELAAGTYSFKAKLAHASISAAATK
jgi:alpha-L-rhamnosidase